MIAYVSYDGALEPLGRSQVVPYVVGLAAQGLRVTLVSFEKPDDYGPFSAPTDEARRLAHALRAAGVRWRPLRYHKRPTLPATLWDVATGVASLARLAARGQLRVVHARSYVAGLMAWMLRKTVGTRFVFDMRGFWPDERVDGGLWRLDSPVYRVVKSLERRFLHDADHVVVLTERAREVLREQGIRGPITVVPTCVDLERFYPAPKAAAVPTLVYAGSLGTVYPLDGILEFFGAARRRMPEARLRIITRATELAPAALQRAGLADGSVSLEKVGHDGMPACLREASVGLAFYRPGFSRQGTCPTKIGEYLASGIPVVVTAGVGDMDRLVSEHRVGVVVGDLSAAAYEAALDELEKLLLDPDLGARCRLLAEDHFSLARGVDRFAAVHASLTGKR